MVGLERDFLVSDYRVNVRYYKEIVIFVVRLFIVMLKVKRMSLFNILEFSNVIVISILRRWRGWFFNMVLEVIY